MMKSESQDNNEFPLPKRTFIDVDKSSSINQDHDPETGKRSSFNVPGADARIASNITSLIVGNSGRNLTRNTCAVWIFAIVILVATLSLSIALPPFMNQHINAGILFGSVQTLICCTIIILSYHGFSPYRRHPNHLIYYRCLMDACLCIRFLLDPVLEHYHVFEIDKPESCKWLSGVTQFLMIGAEAWFFCLSIDLYACLKNPFSDVKQNRKKYHIGVFLVAFTTAILIIFVERLHGFSQGSFCWTNIEKMDPKLKTPFLHPNASNWIMFYLWMGVIYVVGIVVLILAVKRLKTGLTASLSSRRNMLRRSSISVIFYTMYWTVALIFYFLAYRNHKDAYTVGMFSYIIAGRGFTDYVVWFLINDPYILSIERWGVHDKENDDANASAQQNEVLQQEIISFTTRGIAQAVRRAERIYNSASKGKSEKDLRQLLNQMDPDSQSELLNRDSRQKVQFTDYESMEFTRIRRCVGITQEAFLQSFSTTTKPIISEGASGAFLFFSGDRSFIVKSTTQSENQFLKSIARQYADYLCTHEQSLITRFIGCYKVRLYDQDFYFVVMENLFDVDKNVQIHHRFDIKGSWVNRRYKNPREGTKVKCRHCHMQFIYGEKNSCPNVVGRHEPNTVLKDEDMHTKLRIGEEQSIQLYEQLVQDSTFLCSLGIMDYSLLLGVVDVEYHVKDTKPVVRGGLGALPVVRSISSVSATSSMSERRLLIKQANVGLRESNSVIAPGYYYCGIIDILQQWDFNKKLERFTKIFFLRKDPDGLSAIEPEKYRDRFQKKLRQIIDLPNSYRHSERALSDVSIDSEPILIKSLESDECYSTRDSDSTDDLRVESL